MVVPAVRVIVSDDDGSAVPLFALLQRVDGVHQERLFVEWIGVSSVSILIGGGLEVTHGRHIASVDGGPEVGEVILVIRGASVTDLRNRGRRGMVRIRGGLVVLEWLVVWDVVQ